MNIFFALADKPTSATRIFDCDEALVFCNCLNTLDRSQHKESLIAKNQNTFAKRKREMDKKLKAEAKRARRMQRKAEPDIVKSPEPAESSEAPDEAN